jgi:SAM-dependent methyltransferase
VTVLLEERVTLRQGVAFVNGEEPQSSYRSRWEQEAEADHILAAIATTAAEPGEFDQLIGKIAPLWQRFPAGRHVPTLLDIGAGYGRIELYLSRRRGVTCDTLCAVDISEAMLRRLLEYRKRFDLFPDASVHAVCASAHALPLETASVDLALSSAVFLHMGKDYVRRTVEEIARVLKPGGAFVFDNAFPNALNPANVPFRVKPKALRNPNALKYWRRREVERLIRDSGLQARAGAFRLEASSYALLPKSIAGLHVPLARRVNALIGDPRSFGEVLTVSYSAYSESAFA